VRESISRATTDEQRVLERSNVGAASQLNLTARPNPPRKRSQLQRRETMTRGSVDLRHQMVERKVKTERVSRGRGRRRAAPEKRETTLGVGQQN
jgi:hypothetical protein